MIIEITHYYVVCDRCDEEMDAPRFEARQDALNWAHAAGWQTDLPMEAVRCPSCIAKEDD